MNPPLPAIAPAVCPGGLRRVLAAWLWPLLVFLALFASVITSRGAISSVVTLTTSPSVVSNTFNGVITLQITGMTNGVTNVVVQKFLDVNSNGIIDASDLLVQQFRLTAGQANQFMNGATVVTVTNFMPGDMSSTPGQIVAPLNFQNGDFMQTIVGQYLYKVSSPSGQFNPVTNLLVVNNAPYPAAITGAVINQGTSSNVPNAVVFLFSAVNGGQNVLEGAVANSNGLFTLRAPPGTYFLAGAGSNLVANLSQQTLVPAIANFTNVNVLVLLTNATTNVTGRVVNAATNSIKIPGVNGLTESTNGFLSLFLSDTNGNFVMPASSSAWEAAVDNFSAQFAGYLTFQTNLLFNVTNKAVNITNALPPATAIFYGTVTNSSGNPLPGVYMIATDNANHQSLALTDKGGNYVLGVLGETNQWNLAIFNPNNPGVATNNVFSPGYVQTNINAGQAIQQNFTVQLAPYTISGTVQTLGGTPIGGVAMFATATNINGLPYQAFTTTTTASGTYSLNVSPGNWTVGVNAASLISAGFTNIPANQSTNITGANQNTIINFSVLVCTEVAILTTNLPDATVGTPYDATLLATSCQDITNWLAVYGITLTSLFDRTNVVYTNGTPIFSTAGMQGYLLTPFSYGITKVGTTYPYFLTNCTATISPNGPNTVGFNDISATINVSGPIASNTTVTISGRAWTTRSAPSQVSVGSYQTTVFRAGPDSYGPSSKVFSFQANFGLLITGSGKTNTVASLAGLFSSLPTGNSQNLATAFAYAGTNNTVVWLKSGTNWGQYLISSYGPQTTNLPPGLMLYPNGMLAGTPTSTGTNNGLFNFTVEAVDAHNNSGVQTLSLVVNSNTVPPPSPTLATSGTLNSNVFQMQINGVQAGANYTLLMSTNLASTNWTAIFTTNAANMNPLIVPDVNATNPARFYRVQVSP